MNALLSLLIPGAGQMFQEKIGRGLAFFLICAVYYGIGIALVRSPLPASAWGVICLAVAGGIHLASCLDAFPKVALSARQAEPSKDTDRAGNWQYGVPLSSAKNGGVAQFRPRNEHEAVEPAL